MKINEGGQCNQRNGRVEGRKKKNKRRQKNLESLEFLNS
jgi:hypothetical protein